MNNKYTYWFVHNSNARDNIKCVLLIDQLGLEGYGIYWMLLEILREQPDFSYPLAFVSAIARKYNTTKDKVMAVISDYGLFEIREGKFFSKGLIKRMNTNNNHPSGANHWKWKGGITSLNIKLRNSPLYAEWRKIVFSRDNYTCQCCGRKGGALEAHHIKTFAKYPELRFSIDNGITLCKECHKQWHKKNGR